MSLVEVEGLSKVYPSFKLSAVSFSLEPGRIAGFIGRNGAGKTTTIKAMLNLVHPDGGSVRYFGRPLLEQEAQLKQSIGYAAGAVDYYPKKKLGEIAAVSKRFYAAWDGAAYRRYLQLFELDENKTPAQLSAGMRVKFSLLLALAHRAEVLLLDEPTSGLDPFSRDEVLQLLRQLQAEGAAILFSTHITSDLEKCADDIIYIRKGRIVASLSREAFIQTYGREGESLEEIVLRLEREVAP